VSARTQTRNEARSEPSPSSPLLDRIVQEHAATATRGTGAAERQQALARLGALGLPSARDENWRYANLRLLEKARFVPPTPVAPADLAAALPAPITGDARLVFIDGRLAPEYSTLAALRGVRVDTASHDSASRDSASDAMPSQDGAFALLNEAFATDPVQLHVPDTGAPACIELLCVSSATLERGTSYPRLAVHLEPRARARLIERHLSLAGAASSVVAAVAVSIADGAQLDHYRLQQLGEGALWLDSLAATLARDAGYRLHALQLGALAGRSTLEIRLAAPGAQLTLHALAVGQRRQVLDTYAVVEHAAAQTRTEETYRGIAADRSRLAFNGKIIVRAGAHKADSSQSLRGLLAGAEAEIDVRPQLEIYTDDVRCSHGATAGKLDETMLFYLLTRGLERERALRLLKWAFLEDVVSRIEVAELRRMVERSLAGQLSDSDVLADADALQELL
jgi:Fe-S cluster assembly protein SufD